MCLVIVRTVVCVHSAVGLLGNVAVDFVATYIQVVLTVGDVEIDALGELGAAMVCVDMLDHGLVHRSLHGHGHHNPVNVLAHLAHQADVACLPHHMVISLHL